MMIQILIVTYKDILIVFFFFCLLEFNSLHDFYLLFFILIFNVFTAILEMLKTLINSFFTHSRFTIGRPLLTFHTLCYT